MVKNNKQKEYNKIKGKIVSINDSYDFPSIVLECGSKVKRNVNLVCKPEMMETIKQDYKVGDTIALKFFVSSRKKYERWYTNANIIDITK